MCKKFLLPCCEGWKKECEGNMPPFVSEQSKQEFFIGEKVRIIYGKRKGQIGEIIRVDDYRRETWEAKRIRKEYVLSNSKWGNFYYCYLSYQLEKF